jgi:hypothetical protein
MHGKQVASIGGGLEKFDEREQRHSVFYFTVNGVDSGKDFLRGNGYARFFTACKERVRKHGYARERKGVLRLHALFVERLYVRIGMVFRDNADKTDNAKREGNEPL